MYSFVNMEVLMFYIVLKLYIKFMKNAKMDNKKMT